MKLLVSVLALLLCVSFAEESRAGIIIIHTRDTGDQSKVASDADSDDQGGGNDLQYGVLWWRFLAPSSTDQDDQDEESSDIGTLLGKGSKKELDLAPSLVRPPQVDHLAAVSHAQLGEMPASHGDFTDSDDGFDPDAMGCGGASAATGPAGLIPFLVASLPLLRRRRS